VRIGAHRNCGRRRTASPELIVTDPIAGRAWEGTWKRNPKPDPNRDSSAQFAIEGFEKTKKRGVVPANSAEVRGIKRGQQALDRSLAIARRYGNLDGSQRMLTVHDDGPIVGC